MSDEELRALERRWRETGAADAEIAWLSARLRQGQLSLDQLELAAHCGHISARVILGKGPKDPTSKFDDWIQGLVDRDKSVEIVACVAGALQCISMLNPSDKTLATLRDGIDAALQWVRCPCVKHAIDSDDAKEPVFKLYEQYPYRPPIFSMIGVLDDTPNSHFRWLIDFVYEAAKIPMKGWYEDPPRSRLLDPELSDFDLPSPEALRKSICDSMIDWIIDGKLPSPGRP